MQPSLLVPVFQYIALALFCLGLLLAAVLPSRRTTSFTLLHAGVVLLAVACAISDGEVYSRASQLLFVAMQFFTYQLVSQHCSIWQSGPVGSLLGAVEVTLALSGISRGGAIGLETAFIAELLGTVLLLSLAVATLISPLLHSFLAKNNGLPMVMLSLTLAFSIMLRSRHRVLLLPVIHGIYASQTEVAWLAMFAALSASQLLYNEDANAEGRGQTAVVLLIPAAMSCCLTYLGDLSSGVSLVLAASVVMVRCGRRLREVLLAAVAGVVLSLLLSAVVPNMHGCWEVWLDAESRLSLHDVSTRGWMGHVLLCFGVSGLLCLITMTVCTVFAGLKSMTSEGGIGVMVPFLCFSWGIELAIDLLGTALVFPPFFSGLVPFLGVTNGLCAPIFSATAIGIAVACDQYVVEIVATDPGVACLFEVAGSVRESGNYRPLLPEPTEDDVVEA